MEFESFHQLKETPTCCLRIYNQHIPRKNLGNIKPTEALKKWSGIHPDLFKKTVYNLSDLDTYTLLPVQRLNLQTQGIQADKSRRISLIINSIFLKSGIGLRVQGIV